MDPISPAAPAAKKTSPWVWIGCGCGGLVLLAVLAVGAVIWWGKKKVDETTEAMRDPVKREQKAREVLPFDSLPAGFKPLGSFSLPFVMDMAMFTDEDLNAEGKPIDGTGKGQMLIYFKLKVGGSEEAKRQWTAYLKGEGPEPETMRSSGNRIEGEVIERGETTDRQGNKVAFATTRGTFHGRNQQGQHQGLITQFFPDCPGDVSLRMGIWVAKDPAPGESLTQEQMAGTPGDPAALKELLGHFGFCSAPS